MKNIEALPLNKENFEVAVITIVFDLDPEFVSFHHIIRLLMILFTVPIIVKVVNKKREE